MSSKTLMPPNCLLAALSALTKLFSRHNASSHSIVPCQICSGKYFLKTHNRYPKIFCELKMHRQCIEDSEQKDRLVNQLITKVFIEQPRLLKIYN